MAQLRGDIHSVDGQYVQDLGGTFDLLPGCHVIKTPPRWTTSDGSGGHTWVEMTPATYALRMKAGHRYSITIEVTGAEAKLTLRLRGTEVDSDGNLLASLAPVTTSDDLEQCGQWAAQSGDL